MVCPQVADVHKSAAAINSSAPLLSEIPLIRTQNVVPAFHKNGQAIAPFGADRKGRG